MAVKFYMYVFDTQKTEFYLRVISIFYITDGM